MVAFAVFGNLPHGMAKNIYAFGNSEIASPTSIAVGAAFSRHMFTPYDLCGKVVCDITQVIRYNKGSFSEGGGSGDVLETNVSGVSVLVKLDGRVVGDGFSERFATSGEFQLIKNNAPIPIG
ncbi:MULTISPECIES: hypothetical protein [Burkholderia]|nr:MULTISPECIES: hypothetical protein [Burkholderia]MDP9547697.1 hypothetical protein [Burkholderia cepacia]MDO5921659.1 hypothetical protein [Burkholderia cenocepacia]MDP9597949.1 hypothetical protein [Burkholderia cepacia]MDP9626294.1 hypothetical protein [Burkholderia cepacia]MDP9673006.1 hypothetical protein [Burkholderia cepacia]